MNSWGRRAKLHEYRLRSLHKVPRQNTRAPRSPSITWTIFGHSLTSTRTCVGSQILLSITPKIADVILGSRGARSFLHETLRSEHKRYSWSLARRPQLFMFQECIYKISTNLEHQKLNKRKKQRDYDSNVRHEGELVRARCAEKDVQDTQKVENLLLEMMKTSRFLWRFHRKL